MEIEAKQRNALGSVSFELCRASNKTLLQTSKILDQSYVVFNFSASGS